MTVIKSQLGQNYLPGEEDWSIAVCLMQEAGLESIVLLNI